MPEFTPDRLAELRAVAEAANGLYEDQSIGMDDHGDLLVSRGLMLALIAALEAKTADADYWRHSWNREDGYRIDAERERDKALAEVERITESRNEWASRMMQLASETQRADRAEAALERVKALHTKVSDSCPWCYECGPDYSTWPCTTIQAIEGTNA